MPSDHCLNQRGRAGELKLEDPTRVQVSVKESQHSAADAAGVTSCVGLRPTRTEHALTSRSIHPVHEPCAIGSTARRSTTPRRRRGAGTAPCRRSYPRLNQLPDAGSLRPTRRVTSTLCARQGASRSHDPDRTVVIEVVADTQLLATWPPFHSSKWRCEYLPD